MSKVKDHFNNIAKCYDSYKTKNRYYYDNLKKLLFKFIPPNSSICEIGCGTGDLIASLQPKKGYGMDLSEQMIKIAKQKHDNINFSTKYPRNKFGYIFMSDVIEHLENPNETFKKIASIMNKNSIFINTMANPIWEPILMIGEKLGYKMPEGPHYRHSIKEIRKILTKSGLKVTKHGYSLLVPIYIPLLSSFINKYFEKYLKRYAFIEYFTAKKN